ncbi:MAG: N-acetylmuramoyl-L-alanine amidase [Saprospirales bacterium]|nr:N-acetylmuramoyl-L-alanine amidase [Saprospirales bacterium]
MNRIYLILLLSLAAFPAAYSQIHTARAVVETLEQEPRDIPLKDIEPFLAYSAEWIAEPESSLEIRFFQSDTRQWGPWTPLDPDTHSERVAPNFISELGFAPAASTRFEFRNSGGDLQNLRFHFFNPGKSSPEKPLSPEADRAICPCPLPEYLDRLGWCPSGNCPSDPTPQPTSVTHLIVHHSAGGNTSSDWAAVVRSIWDYHVNSNGWDDIGYNWLIDPNGVLYEGRGNDLQGAHFCGYNVGTMGVCMMGTYTSVPPTPESFDKLKQLLAWKCCDRDIDPEDFNFHPNSGLNLFNISGHQDGCSTACPGDSIYARLPVLRTDVKDFIDNTCDATAVSEIEQKLQIQVFPNPARDVLNIQLPAEMPTGTTLSLLDPHGRAIWTSKSTYRGGELISLSVKGFPRGWYSLQTGFRQTPLKVFLQ